MASVQYFAYGSNMLTERLQARCNSAIVRCVASADEYRLGFSKKSQDGSGSQRRVPAPNMHSPNTPCRYAKADGAELARSLLRVRAGINSPIPYSDAASRPEPAARLRL